MPQPIWQSDSTPPPPPYSKIPVEHLKSLHGASLGGGGGGGGGPHTGGDPLDSLRHTAQSAYSGSCSSSSERLHCCSITRRSSSYHCKLNCSTVAHKYHRNDCRHIWVCLGRMYRINNSFPVGDGGKYQTKHLHKWSKFFWDMCGEP